MRLRSLFRARRRISFGLYSACLLRFAIGRRASLVPDKSKRQAKNSKRTVVHKNGLMFLYPWHNMLYLLKTVLKTKEETELVNREGWNPGRLLQLSGQYWPTCTLHAAVKLGVFSAIGNEQITSGDIAQKLNGDKKGVTRLLDALAAMNLLEKAGDKYSNTPESSFFLSKDSPEYLGHMIMHHHHLVDSWSRLDHRPSRPARLSGQERLTAATNGVRVSLWGCSTWP